MARRASEPWHLAWPSPFCDAPVGRDEMELEIEFDRHGRANPGLDKFHVHVRCFAVWELERKLE